MDLRYPIGRADLPEKIEMSDIQEWIEELKEAPSLLKKVVSELSDKQLDTPYRQEGWTVRQVVHHVADSHMNTYMNFRLGLTEECPTIRTTDVDAWAMLKDYRTLDIQVSLKLFTSLQKRWVALLRTMSTTDFERKIRGSDGKERTLATLLGIYAWHGKHHAAQIASLRERMDW